MKSSSKFRPYLIRLGVILVISIIGVAIFNEVVFRLQKGDYDRAPSLITLVIPEGTAEKVQAGENVSSMPSEMVFVVGDVLEVKNEDTVSHQLGPVWVPAGTTGRLVLSQAEASGYSCSFRADQYMGLDVRPPTTLATRLAGLGLGAPTVAALLFIYSLVLYPLDGKKKIPASNEATQGRAP